MLRIAKFEKVSYTQFLDDMEACFPNHEEWASTEEWENYCSEAFRTVEKPKRATTGSAGYDFVSPIDILLEPGETAKFPTGIRVKIEPGWYLGLYPRSGLGFKYRLQMDNTVGIIDSDYYFSDNEGHIHCKMTNNGGKFLMIKAGERFAQGIFQQFGITEDDNADGVRNGGFGSTGNK